MKPMSLRIFSGAAFALALASCGGGAASPEPEGNTIDCAIGPGADFSTVCTLERVSESEIVIHHPDGGFRRFSETSEGFQVLDGAAPLESLGGMSHVYEEVGVEGDRYRLPLPLDARD